MGKPISTVAEAQLKGRRTSLGKKSKEELINIILRKDKTERLNSTKIKALQDGNFELISEVDNLNREIIVKRDKINTQYEQINALKSEIQTGVNLIEGYDKDVIRLKYKCNFLIRGLWISLIVILGLISIIVYF